MALIDTGAGGNCIDEPFARAIGLPVMSQGYVSGISGPMQANLFTFRVYIPNLDRLIFEPFAGVRLAEGGQWQRIILGRNFLRPYRMTYDAPTGAVELTDEI